jgi:hypothetical protein
MKLAIAHFLALCLIVVAVNGFCQEPPQMPEPTEQHAWLDHFVGNWVTKSEGTLGPDQPPMQCSGTMASRKLGGFWVLNEMKGDMGGAPMTGVQTIGYDESKKKYVGTWVDSMMPFMWQYEGSLDASGKILTLEADGPNFVSEGKLTKFQDIYEFKSADEIAMTSKMLGDDGKWITFMSGMATRKR